MHGRRCLGVLRFDQAEHLAALLVHPFTPASAAIGTSTCLGASKAP
jgi:hypothetical protein